MANLGITVTTKSFSIAGRRAARTIALAVPFLTCASLADAAVVNFTNGTLEESPYGLPATMGGSVTSINLTGKVGANNFTTSGVTVIGTNNPAVQNNSPIVQGSSANNYAAPVTGSSGATMTTPYFSTGAYSGQIELDFATPEKYLGFLWGSIDTVNTVTFYSGSTAVATITGSQAQAAGPSFGTNGQQTFGGSQYILINFINGITFNKVVLSETNSNPNLPSFEAGLFQYSATNQKPLPEPASVALLGIGAGAFLTRRRKAKQA